ncbi:hypothetical protein ElyMa_000295000 [Elysia marginata]|uniref:TB domain-containing protein n=1 Tax=Elysia marginata TaxID=1093978 RepID=A0AAV4F9M1_9GAST|nr:hypothetical protein ElyMa_000295000 [Elysia marginata]
MKAVVIICLCLVALTAATRVQVYEDCLHSMDCLTYPASQARKTYCCQAGFKPRMNWWPFYCECEPGQCEQAPGVSLYLT